MYFVCAPAPLECVDHFAPKKKNVSALNKSKKKKKKCKIKHFGSLLTEAYRSSKKNTFILFFFKKKKLLNSSIVKV